MIGYAVSNPAGLAVRRSAQEPRLGLAHFGVSSIDVWCRRRTRGRSTTSLKTSVGISF